jgi:hypothetical protein
MIRALAILALIPTAALAQTVENPTLLPSGVVRMTIKSEVPISLQSATLSDSSGEALDPIGKPSGIPYSGTNQNCDIAEPINGEVVIPFKLPGQAPYSLTLKFETPNKGVPADCRAIHLTVDVR